MGSGNSKTESLHYDVKDWDEVERSTLYEVMRSKRGEQGHLYHFSLKDEFDIDDEIDTYLRRKAQANWVQVLGANLSSSGFGFCGSQENVCVLTQPIPVLLNSVNKLNKQQSTIVLYNALKGYADLSTFVVPAAITDKMIGFNKSGQTKVWVNENFGMNHPGYHHSDATLDEASVLNNLVNAISSKLDIAPEFLNNVRNSRRFSDALNFIRSNGGVADNVLQNNRVNVAGLTSTKVAILKDTTPVQNVPVQSVPVQNVQVQNVPLQNTFVSQPPTNFVQTPSVYYQPQVIPQSVQSGFRVPPVTYQSTVIPTTTSFQSGYQVPRYVDSVGPNKYSFVGAQ